MAKGSAPGEEERLPWLEPYRDAIAHKRKIARRSHGGLVAVATGLAVLFAAGGGYWFGQRGDRPAQPPPTAIVEAPVTQAPESSPPPPSPTAEAVPPADVQAASPPAPVKVAAAPDRPPARPRKIRTAGLETARLREVRSAQEQDAARPPPLPSPPPQSLPPTARENVRSWPKMPSPGPAGQVVQLGAFRTEARAQAALRTRLSRYPVLGSMPRVIVPVVTRPRNRVLYVLRLGTASRQQSRVVCRNLRASGDHCIVIG